MSAISVAVDGGRIAFEVSVGSTAPVVCIHGISTQRKLWLWLQQEAPELTLVAMDLRGRGDSFDVAGPSSLGRHAADVLAVMDAVGLERAMVCGMSMGGNVAVELAVTYPERVASAVLVDGGVQRGAPVGLRAGNVGTLFADRFGRLDRTWSSLDEYKEFFLAETAPLLDPSDPVLDRYLEHDLDAGVVRLAPEALISDAVDVFFGHNRWDELDVPVHFLHAEWGKGAGSEPGYSVDAVAASRAKATTVTAIRGVDHAGSIMSKAGAAATAEVIRASW